MKPSNWNEYFIKQAEYSADSDPSNFIDTSTPPEDSNRDLLLSKLTSDNGESVLIYFSKFLNSIQIVHNVANLGNSNHHPDPILVALSGLSEKTAMPVFIDLESLTEEFEFDAPTNTRLISTSDPATLSSLDAPSTNPVKMKSFPFILVPPCLWEVILSSVDRSPDNLFFEIKEEILKLKEEWKDIDELKNSYKDLYVILRFLWAAKKDLIKTIQLELASDNFLVSNWSKSRHSFCIYEPGPQVNVPNQKEKEVSNMEAFSEAINSLRNSSTPEDLLDSSQKGFNKLYASTQHMILNASATNSEIKAGAPSKFCSDFFKSPKTSSARHLFINEMESHYKCNMETALGVITNLYHGVFLRNFTETPSNFSPFSFPKQSLFGSNPESDCLVLLLKESSSKGISNDDIEGILKQGVIVPRSAESLRVSIHNFWGAASFFFSSDSLLPLSIQKIHDDIVMNTTIYESLIDQNKEFTAQFLFSIDTNVQLWLKECRNEKFREDVDDELIDFSSLLRKVKTRQFIISLPSSFKHLIEKDSNHSNSTTDNPSKKRKTNNNNSEDRVENRGMIQDWIVDNDVYVKKLRHGKHLQERPQVEDYPMCHRWHSKGYCFGNCGNISTHIDSSKLSDTQKEKYSTWLKKSVK